MNITFISVLKSRDFRFHFFSFIFFSLPLSYVLRLPAGQLFFKKISFASIVMRIALPVWRYWDVRGERKGVEEHNVQFLTALFMFHICLFHLCLLFPLPTAAHICLPSGSPHLPAASLPGGEWWFNLEHSSQCPAQAMHTGLPSLKLM